MAAAESNSVMVQQLSRQLHAVSEIAESLTLRLLSLEERFEQFHLQVVSEGAESVPDDASCQLLDDSGDRLRHLQGLLNEATPGQVVELVSPTELGNQSSSVDPLSSQIESGIDSEDELESSQDETVYVDDPQIDPSQDDVTDQDEDDQIDLLSA